MTIKFCPHCQQRYSFQEHTSDFVHECNSGDTTLDQEDIIFFGDYEDYTGSGVFLPKAFVRSTVNSLQGQRAGINGADLETFTDRGRRRSNFRQRQHLEFIQIAGGQ